MNRLKIGIGVLFHNHEKALSQGTLSGVFHEIELCKKLFVPNSNVDFSLLAWDNASTDKTTSLIDKVLFESDFETRYEVSRYLYSPENVGKVAFNKMFDMMNLDDIDLFIEIDGNVLLVPGSIYWLIYSFCKLLKEEKVNIASLGVDYFISLVDRDQASWNGAKTFATSQVFTNLTLNEKHVTYIINEQSDYNRVFLYDKNERGLAFGGCRVTLAKAWKEIGGQPNFLYGTDRYMNIMFWNKGYLTGVISPKEVESISKDSHNIYSPLLIKMRDDESVEYRRWKRSYMLKNCILPGNKEIWR